MDPEEVDHAPHLVVGLVLHVGEAKKFPPELGFERLDPFLRVSRQGPSSIAIEPDGGGRRLEQLELACDFVGGVHGVRKHFFSFLPLLATASPILSAL